MIKRRQRPEQRARRQRGVSLIEALVAMAVMAFGMLGIIGVQTTLRFNSDVAKQRSEAVRLAQKAIEDARSFTLVEASSGPDPDYTDIDTVTGINSAYVSSATNTTYTIDTAVLPYGDTPDSQDPRYKKLRVRVNWADRSSNLANEVVQLDTSVARVMPELSGTLALATLAGANGVTQRPPSGRNALIPILAVDQGNGTSNFTPPGTLGVTWVFNNTTGLITIVNDAFCGGGGCLLLSGYIRFATGNGPTGMGPVGRSEIPDSSAISAIVQLNQLVPNSPVRTVNCYSRTYTDYVSYYCAVAPTDPVSSPVSWSGQSLLTPTLALPISSALSDAARGNFKVCRYTPDRGVVNNVDLGDVPTAGNVAHPLNYVSVTTSLINQNFLVISAGDGTAVFSCPADDTSTPLVNGNTWQHQPHS